MKKNVIFFNLLVIALILFFTGCSLPGSDPISEKEVTKTDTAEVNALLDNNLSKAPMTKYPAGLIYASKEAHNIDIASEYKEWKKHYLTTSGCPNDGMRIQRDAATNYDTVSEGIGYGMLLAVYMSDKKTFDQLYNYCEAHFVSSSIPLMHWKVDADGNNVSEFNDYKKETKPITIGIGYAGYTVYPKSVAIVPHGLVYFNKSTGAVFIFPTEAELKAKNKDLFKKLKENFDNKSNYYLGATYDRKLGSATDADADIAAALCFAAKKWNSSTYSSEAAKMIKAIKQNDFDGYFIKNGSLWGGQEGWNPSYFTPAWYRIFAEHCPDQASFWNNVRDTMYKEMYIFANRSDCKLWPDWCNTSNGIPQKCTISDRFYYMPNNGAIYQKMSYNFYYDAVRVPWRLAVDYSWNGANLGITPPSLKCLKKAIAFFKDKVTTLVDGYSVSGGAWNWSNRDGFNSAKGGKNHSTTFVAMAATTTLPGGDWTVSGNYFKEVEKTKESYESDYNYYGNTLRLLTLIYLRGNFVNLYKQ